MKTIRHLAFGFLITLVAIFVALGVLGLIGIISYQLEALAQNVGLYGEPDPYTGKYEPDGAVFAISFIVILAGLIGGAAYAYDKSGDES